MFSCQYIRLLKIKRKLNFIPILIFVNIKMQKIATTYTLRRGNIRLTSAGFRKNSLK
jgi:hypothetical protein